MKKGKPSYNSMIRSVLRVPFERRERDHIGRDGVFADKNTVISVNTVVSGGDFSEKLAFYRAYNDALAAGCIPEKLLLSLTLPGTEKEDETRARMEKFLECAERENMALCGGHTAYSEQVLAPVLTAVIEGKIEASPAFDRERPKGKALYGRDILMTKHAGDAGAMVLCRAEWEILSKTYTEDWLSGALSAEERLSCREEAKILREAGAWMHDISEGGILAALYEAADGGNFGFTVDLKKIPVHQETIEICESLGANPYRLLSTGCMLAFVEKGEEVAEKLKEAGIFAEVIGHTEEGKRKILVKGEEESNLEKPSQDPVYLTKRFG